MDATQFGRPIGLLRFYRNDAVVFAKLQWRSLLLGDGLRWRDLVAPADSSRAEGGTRAEHTVTACYVVIGVAGLGKARKRGDAEK